LLPEATWASVLGIVRTLLSLLVIAALVSGAAPPATAESYPSGPITLVIPLAPGDSTDTTGRVMAEELAKLLKVPVVPVNRPGAGMVIGTDSVVKAKKDGYTILITPNASVVSARILNPESVTYDPLKDLTPLGLTIEGVAGPEAANNAAAGGAFIPLLTLGIPANAVMAILLGALMIHGLQPGPLLVKQAPDVFWGIITSMYIGNAMLLVLNLPLIPLWARLLRVPYAIMFPFILLFCLIGAYSVGNNVGDGLVMWVFGVVGYLLKKFDYEGAPLILAMVIGPMMEESLRQSLILSGGDFAVFVSRPISAAFIVAAAVLLLLPLLRSRTGVHATPWADLAPTP
jgi:hypothetical protein